MDSRNLPRWMKKLFDLGGKDALAGQGKHSRGKQRKAGARRALRNKRKRQRQARKASRK